MQCDGHDGDERLLYKKREEKKRKEKKRKCSKRGKEKTTARNETKPIPTLRTPRGEYTKKMKRKKGGGEKVCGYQKLGK